MQRENPGKPTEEQMKRKRERARARYALQKAQLQQGALAGDSGDDPFARRRARDRERYARKKAQLQLRAPTEAQLERKRERERERYARKTALQGLTQAELERKRVNNRARYARLKALQQLKGPAEKEGVGRKRDKTLQKTEQRQREVSAIMYLCLVSSGRFCRADLMCSTLSNQTDKTQTLSYMKFSPWMSRPLEVIGVCRKRE
ncbi:hypothetical protein HPB50_005939 [Hyalomma asiaticum]|uniref:Uncharacterized protein n=1 Tax=Hyalomma asiaticum TaxID=266040 RepID=A0ACB7RMW4_HYAAI|nr:hypothetical protein HPB50_005939 [Hyalomma asiaticum]